MLGRAEAACVRFFAMADTTKRRCSTAHLHPPSVPPVETPEQQTLPQPQQPKPSLALAEARTGGGYRAHGPKWREQYHIVVGAWAACFRPAVLQAASEEERAANMASAELSTALRPALEWYESFCLALAELLVPGLRARLKAEIAAHGGDDPSVLDAFIYPNLARGTAEPNMCAHFDPGFITITTASATPGLDAQVDGHWLDVEAHADAGTELVCFLSESMRRAVATASDIWDVERAGPQPSIVACNALNHRVHRNTSTGAAPRSSLVYELRSIYTGM